MSRFSKRLPPHAERNAITAALDALPAGTHVIDLTESNPTTAGFVYDDDLLAPLADPAALTYAPSPLGLRSAREAVAAAASVRGVVVDPGHIVLSSSSSESYSWLFKLLCDPGEAVLVPRPSYPLFEHLTGLEAVRAVPYDLEYHGRWQVDFASVEAAPPDTSAVLVVSPNNPTGQYLSGPELERLTAICQSRGWALIADEVFADYALEAEAPVTDLATRAGVLTFSLGGASKSLGLPQLKLGWTVVGGPPADRDAALSALELIADTYLSVGTPVQVAAPELLRRGAAVRRQIQARTARNLASARRIVERHPACALRPVEGGWSAVLRVPATRSEERLVLDLLHREHILVHPGFFFDFAHEAFVIVSLLPRTDIFEDAFTRLVAFASS